MFGERRKHANTAKIRRNTTKNCINFGGVDITTDPMHPGTTRGLDNWTMVKEAIPIAHSDCGVANFPSSGRLLASNETPFDQKKSYVVVLD